MTQANEHVITNMGFDWGDVAVERCFSHDGYKCIRIRHMRTGKFLDVQVSPAGSKITAYPLGTGVKGFDPCGGKKAL